MELVPALFNLAIGICGLVVIVAAFLYVYQNKMIYQPNPMMQMSQYPDGNPNGYRSPADRGIPYQDVYLNSSPGVKIHAWLMTQTYKSAPTVVFFHANAGNLGYRMDNYEMLYSQLRLNVFAVSYRGYGYSEGTPSEEGLKLDAQAAIKYVFEETSVDKNKVFLFGRSLGGAVAIYAASKFQEYPVKGLILENTFTSMPKLVDHIMPKISFMKGLILKNFWDSQSLIGNLECGILFISGTNDELVPPVHMQQLKDSAVKAKTRDMVRLT